MLEMGNPQQEPLLIVGDLNAHTAVLNPTMEGQLLCVSTDTVLNTRGCALLSLLIQQELLLLSDTTQLSCQATSFGGSGPKSALSVMHYTIASHATAAWVIGVTVGNALLMLNYHCMLMLSLGPPAPQATSISALPTLCAHWELDA